jgi:hypothetical protein
MTSFFDALETRDADVREAALMVALPAGWHSGSAPAFAEIFRALMPAQITSRATLANCQSRKHGAVSSRRLSSQSQ